ncbi:hypothetical protein C0J52_07804 [Blattella germanica]|nr:hypothetical protein C0J52_07804 [Blattella germanica]
MSTSLAAQLKKLAVPQTTLLQEKNKRPSLLFDPREAAKFDRDTFYEIGVSGLEELVKLNSKFEQFQNSLFDLSSRSLERSVEDTKANKKLNKLIRKFLLLLSPYFLIKSSHKTLEWLVNRFHIESFNVDDLMSLIFPYHNSRMFVRVLQIIDVSDPANKWHWLHPLQKPGVPLSKTALLNRCSSDPSFLKFVCNTTSDAIKVYKESGHVLATLLAFHCTTLIGGLEHSKRVTEVQVTHMLKTLLAGLTSPIVDYCAASYMIIAELARRTKSECALLLVLLYQTQNLEDMPKMPAKTLKRIVRLSWLPQALGQLRVSGVQINSFLMSLLQEILLDAQKRTDERIDMCNYAEDLVRDGVDTTLASQAMQVIVENFDVDGLTASKTDLTRYEEDGKESEKEEHEKEEEESDVEKIAFNIDDAEEIIKWYSGFFQSFEQKFPDSFDQVIHKYLKKDEAASKHGKAVRVLLGVAKNADNNFLEGGIDLFQKLHHPSSALRANAIRYLVIKETLGFPTEVLVELLGAEKVLEELITLSIQCLKHGDDKHWCAIANMLVKHMCSEKLQIKTVLAETQIVLALLPFLFPRNKKNDLILRQILNQEQFIGKSKLLSSLSKELKPKGSGVSAKDAASVFVRCLSERTVHLDLEGLVECAEKVVSQDGKTVHFLFLLLTLGSSVNSNIKPALSRKILDMFTSYIANHEVIVVPGDLMESSGKVMLESVNKSRMGYVPVSAFLYCMLQLTRHTPLPTALKSENIKWWNLYFTEENDSESALRFTVKMLEVLIVGCGSEKEAVRMCYAEYLKEFFKNMIILFLMKRTIDLGNIYFLIIMLNVFNFTEIVNKFHISPFIILNYFIGDTEDGIFWPQLRLRCLNLLWTILKITNASLKWTTSLEEPIVPALLVAASSPLSNIRHRALSCLLKIGSPSFSLSKDGTYIVLIQKIKEREEEVKLDAEQLPLVMYTSLSPDKDVVSLLNSSEKPLLAAALDKLLNCVTSKETPLYVTVGLLNLLMSVNSQEIFIKLISIGHNTLLTGKDSGSYLDANRSAILCNVIQRLNFNTASCMNKSVCSDFVYCALMDWKTKVLNDTGKITREFFDALDDPQQQKLLASLVKAASDCDLPEVGSAAGKAVKKVLLNGKLIAVELEKMKSAQVSEDIINLSTSIRRPRRRSLNMPPSPALLETETWRHGVTLLEWLQSKKKLQSVDALLSPLFSILDKCLAFEQQAPVEYTKQLVLSCVLHCCQKLTAEGTPIEKSVLQTFNLEAVVQCIRGSQNPQTHHHALLLVAYVAGIMPEQVLHHIMAIFTFMGSSILRHDDAYSFQVISNILETVIPILVKASDNVGDRSSEVDGAVCAVMRVFADAALHVPAHRRLLVYQKLLDTLGPDRTLWIFVCLVLEGHVVHGEDQTQDRRERGELPQRQEFILNLTKCFPPSTIITTSIKLVKYLQVLLSTRLFDVDVHSAKQFRHYKYSICTFLSTFLSSPHFVQQIAELNDEDIHDFEPMYQELIEYLLTHIKLVSHLHLQSIPKNRNEQLVKYWSFMLNLAYDILDKVNALLPSSMFLIVIRGLLNHKLPTVRRKAMELLNTRLQHQAAIFATCERKAFYKLLEPLTAVMENIGKENAEPEIETNQQVAMLSIKLLARQLAPEDPAHFKQILERVTDLLESKAVQKNLLASVVLCLAELVSVLRAHAIGKLNKFMPAILKILKMQKDLESPNLIVLSVVTATQKIVENLPHFLSPYLGKVLLEVSILSVKWQHLNEDVKMAPIQHKLKAVRQKISNSIPPRVLIPAIGSCYTLLLNQKQYAALGPLLSVMADSFSLLENSEFTQLMPDVTAFFLLALQFRSDSDNAISEDEISEAEKHVVNALVALVLKLSETTFRPLYHSLFHWATNTEENKDRLITFYRLSSSIAEALKGLFVLFAGRLVQNAAKLLDLVNLSKLKEEEREEELLFEDEEKAQLLLQYILETLHRMFLHDSGQGFLSKERFDALLLPIVNQLENTLGGVEALQSRASSLLSPCITQFAVAVADDALWKQLNYQVLLKTRNTLPQIRLAALEVLCEMARKLGEDFLPLLPETVPFLAELLEDEEETVETACQKAVQDLEEILGEPLKKYF